MAADQQFCLRWNNHQSTLISVFDTLLENGTLVDCTLAAEGQYLKAHKVVLSACSPYMETLLSQNYDKHPILILKDVKFTELKSMMDYMYRGEVNISQDQLGTFLKAAESLQIKGLSENGEGDARDVGSTNTNPPPPRRPPATRPEPEAAQSPAHRSRDGSVSPSSRKRRRLRRNSDDGDNHIESNSCDVPAQSTPVPNIPASITTTPIRTPIVKPEVNDRLDHNTLPAESGLLKEKIEPAEPLLEPKTEYLEDLNNDDSVEDLTLDDDDEMDMSQMSNLSNMSRPGPSHGADLSNQGFPPWQLGNQSGTDEVFMAAQEAVNAHRDSQGVEAGAGSVGLEVALCSEVGTSQFLSELEEPQVGIGGFCLGKETESNQQFSISDVLPVDSKLISTVCEKYPNSLKVISAANCRHDNAAEKVYQANSTNKKKRRKRPSLLVKKSRNRQSRILTGANKRDVDKSNKRNVDTLNSGAVKNRVVRFKCSSRNSEMSSSCITKDKNMNMSTYEKEQESSATKFSMTNSSEELMPTTVKQEISAFPLEVLLFEPGENNLGTSNSSTLPSEPKPQSRTSAVKSKRIINRPQKLDDYLTYSFVCTMCGRSYQCFKGLRRHQKYHCKKSVTKSKKKAPVIKPKRKAIKVDENTGSELKNMKKNSIKKKMPKRQHSLDPSLFKHKCENCGNRYMYNRGLRQHQRLVCNKGPQFCCTKCPFKAFYPQTLRNHVNESHGEIFAEWYATVYPSLMTQRWRTIHKKDLGMTG